MRTFNPKGKSVETSGENSHSERSTGFPAVTKYPLQSEVGTLHAMPGPEQSAEVAQFILMGQVGISQDGSERSYESASSIYHMDPEYLWDHYYDSADNATYTKQKLEGKFLYLTSDADGKTVVYDLEADAWVPQISSAPASSAMEETELESSTSSSTPAVKQKRKSRWGPALSSGSSLPSVPLKSAPSLSGAQSSQVSLPAFGSSQPSFSSGFGSLSSPSPRLDLTERKEPAVTPAVSASSVTATSSQPSLKAFKAFILWDHFFDKHRVHFDRGQSHSVFVGSKSVVEALVYEVWEMLADKFKNVAENRKKVPYSLDMGRLVGFQSSTEGERNQFPMTNMVEGYVSIAANSSRRTLTLLTCYPGPPYNKGTLDENGYKLDKGKPKKK